MRLFCWLVKHRIVWFFGLLVVAKIDKITDQLISEQWNRDHWHARISSLDERVEAHVRDERNNSGIIWEVQTSSLIIRCVYRAYQFAAAIRC